MAKTLTRVLLTLSLVLLLAVPALADDSNFLGTEQVGGTIVLIFKCTGGSPSFQIGASYDWNELRRLAASFGEAYHVILDDTGIVLNFSGAAASSKEIEIRNDLVQGAINAHFYINGQKVATSSSIHPGQKAKFGWKCQTE